jgi:integrase
MSAKVIPLQRPKAKLWERVSHNMVRHLPTGTYYARKTQVGKDPLFKSTGSKKKMLAQTIADQMVEDWRGGRLSAKRAGRVKSFLPIVDESLQKKFEAGKRDAVTREKDRDFLVGRDADKPGVIARYFGDMLLTEIDEDFWEDWADAGSWRAERSTLFDVAKYLSIVLKHAHRKKLIGRKPQIRNPDAPKTNGREKIVQPAEMKAIAQVLTRNENRWLLAQLYLGAECGNRTCEVYKLAWPMVSFRRDGARHIAIVNFEVDKAGREKGTGREIQLSQRAGELLWELHQSRDPKSPWVFPRPTDRSKHQTKVYQNRAWRRALALAGIRRRLLFYWLRHTFYTRALLEAREPVQHVSEYGGTSIPTLQKKYMHADAKRTRSVASAVRLGEGDDAEE